MGTPSPLLPCNHSYKSIYSHSPQDGDFLTLRSLLTQNTLGHILEAEITYDFDRAPWLHRMTATEYTPGSGHTFGLGMCLLPSPMPPPCPVLSCPVLSYPPHKLTSTQGTHSLDQALLLFGRPTSVTAFLRAQRSPASPPSSTNLVEDSFTIILQYADTPLLVTVKTAVVSPMQQQLKFRVRGTDGSYTKYQARSTCPQEESIAAGMHPTDADFALEEESMRGVLASYEKIDEGVQSWDEGSGRWVGRVPSARGRWMGLYEDVALHLREGKELGVKIAEVRDVLRVVELARESHVKGVTVAWH
jgi:predicted dehydrogenase